MPLEPKPTLRSSVRVRTKTVHQIMVSGTSPDACQSASSGDSNEGIAEDNARGCKSHLGDSVHRIATDLTTGGRSRARLWSQLTT